MAADIQKMFNEDLPGAMAAKPDAAKEIGSTFQINVSGDGGGEWFIDCSDAGPGCTAGNPGGADCTVDIAIDDFQTLIENPGNGMALFSQGKLKVGGNIMLAMKLQKLFALGD